MYLRVHSTAAFQQDVCNYFHLTNTCKDFFFHFLKLNVNWNYDSTIWTKRASILFSEKKLNGPHFKHGCRLPSNIHVNEGLLKDRIKTTRKWEFAFF